MAVSVALGLVAAYAGQIGLALPTARRSAESLPLWRMLSVAVAVVPSVAAHSDLEALEEMATQRLRATLRRYLAGLHLLCSAVFIGLAALTLTPSALGAMARAIAAWIGLSLMAGRVLGWRSCWILPIATFCAIAFWGGSPGTYKWWDVGARPINDPWSMLAALGALLVGIAAYACTPWRLSRVKAFVRSDHARLNGPCASHIRRQRTPTATSGPSVNWRRRGRRA